MQTTYVIGHKKPDTDSVCSAISYSYLKEKLGFKTEPRVLGMLNKETKFVLDYFGIKEPEFLNEVKVQIRNMKYNKEAFVNEHVSIEETFNEMQTMKVTGLPLVDDNKKLKGYVNVKEMAKYIIEGDIYSLSTSYDNIIKVLDGSSILKFDEEINGKIIAAAYKSKTFTERVNLTSDNILIVADRPYIIDYAILCGVKLIIIVGNNEFPKELLEKAKEKKINVIATPYTTYLTANKIKLCNYIKNININSNPIKFTSVDYRDTFIDIANKYGHTNYPIVDNDNTCVGMLSLIDQNNYEKRNLILVDHNQIVQSVDGIEEANILEVVDHHNLGALGTTMPISFRTMPVGCTSTIIYEIYRENHIEIPYSIAGLMLSAILSDTLLLKSPTTTNKDIEVAKTLASIVNLDIQEYGMQMLKAGSSIKGLTPEEVVTQDFKTFKLDSKKIGIGQVMTMDFLEIKDNIKAYIDVLNKMTEDDEYDIALLFVTDIIKNGSYIIYNDKAVDIVSNSYDIVDISEGSYIPNMVSRKKQMYPLLAEFLEG